MFSNLLLSWKAESPHENWLRLWDRLKGKVLVKVELPGPSEVTGSLGAVLLSRGMAPGGRIQEPLWYWRYCMLNPKRNIQARMKHGQRTIAILRDEPRSQALLRTTQLLKKLRLLTRAVFSAFVIPIRCFYLSCSPSCLMMVFLSQLPHYVFVLKPLQEEEENCSWLWMQVRLGSAWALLTHCSVTRLDLFLVAKFSRWFYRQQGPAWQHQVNIGEYRTQEL